MVGRKGRRRIGRRWLIKAAAALGLRGWLLNGPRVARADPPRATPFALPDPPDEPSYRLYLPSVTSAPLARGPSKLGVHTVRPNNALGFVEDVYAAGACVPLVKAVDDFGYLRLVKERSPETITVGRSTCRQWADVERDPAQEAADVLAAHMPNWSYEQDVVDYWEVLNENDPPTVEGHRWLAEFYLAAMDIAEAHGYRLALFSYSVGVPEWYEWAAIYETGVFARALEGGHVLALHEYNWPTMDALWGEPLPGHPAYADRGVLTGRYRHLYRDFLVPNDEVVPLLITECGLDAALAGAPMEDWQARYVAEMVWYDTRLREDAYVLGAAMFTLGGAWGWEAYDYEALLPDFYAYIVSLKDA